MILTILISLVIVVICIHCSSIIFEILNETFNQDINGNTKSKVLSIISICLFPIAPLIVAGLMIFAGIALLIYYIFEELGPVFEVFRRKE